MYINYVFLENYRFTYNLRRVYVESTFPLHGPGCSQDSTGWQRNGVWIAEGWPRITPAWPQDAPRMAQDTPQDIAEMLSGQKIAQGYPGWTQDG